ncbi:MAG: type 2 lantipeptide synthetase LanM family protein [Labilithrix sp.]|nr:type 2 lantipeptide synthetase LanM family protein [Labilithrix sp.]
MSLRSHAWFAALNFAERAGVAPSKERSERFDRWRKQSPFDLHPTLWSDRLAEGGFGEPTFAALLAESAAESSARVRAPDWMIALDEALAAHAAGRAPDPLLAQAIASEAERYHRAALRLVAPFIERELPRLRAAVMAAATRAPLDEAALLSQAVAHVAELAGLPLMRVVAFEVSVARARGLLTAASSEARFDELIDAIADAEALLYFYERHAVLARHVSAAIACFTEACATFFTHLGEDWPELLASLAAGRPPGPLVEMKPGAGDTHRRGKTVIHLRFESGLRLVYKPRAGDVDDAYAALLEWLAARGGDDVFVAASPKIVSRGDHLWSAFVARDACDDRAAVERFYRRQGAHLALFYVLGATDMHAENMIAAGEHPMLVDLEALLAPRISLRPELEDTNPAADVALASVLGALFLPARVEGTDETPGFDVSALGHRPGQRESRPMAIMKNVATDEMRVAYERPELDETASRPILDGQELDAADWVDVICDGFTRAWEVLAAHRDELVAGPLDRFRRTAIRIIPRATRVYAAMLMTSYHPSLLSDGLERERVFDKLWLGVRYEPLLGRLVASERADLHDGDVPFFSMIPSSRDVLDSRGRVIADAFSEAPLEAAARRARSLDAAEMRRQLWLIRASFATITLGEGEGRWVPSIASLEPVDVSRDALLARAGRIAERLEALAIERDGRVGWLGVALQRERDWMVMPSQTDLYNGTPGIALFLAHLGKVTGATRWTELARAAMNTVVPRLRVRVTSSQPIPVGAIGEIGGALFAFAHLGVLLEDEALLDAAVEIARDALVRHASASKDDDVAEGHAGCVLALLALHAARPSSDLLAIAARSGDALRARARTRAEGMTWSSTIPSSAPLAGFSHGGSGIAIALLRFAAATSDERLVDLARGALAYERTLFDEEAGGWPDLRDIAGRGRVFATHWCHGAPGIGLARLEAHRALRDPQLLDEARAAVRATERSGFGSNHSLCHGDFGNLELLFAARDLDGDRSRRAFVERLGRVCASLDRQGPLPGVPLGIETPGLFAGLAGIGWQLLRFAAPESVPSVLLFDPPVSGSLPDT